MPQQDFRDKDRHNGWLHSQKVQKQIDNALNGSDDGDLFLETRKSEILSYSDQKLQTAQLSTSNGFGFRVVCGELVGSAFSNRIAEDALEAAIDATTLVKDGYVGKWDVSPERTNQIRYDAIDPLDDTDIKARIEVLQQVDAYIRGRDNRVVQVNVSLTGVISAVDILRPDGEHYNDIRPLVQISIQVVMHEKARAEIGTSASGGRFDLSQLLQADVWQSHADEALRMARVNLTSVPAPAGETTVILDAGWPGVMVHEAVGHGLEGDAIFKNQSAYAGMVGEQVAAKGVTIIDDGTFQDRRGSLSIDDEGTPSQENVLIEDGILKGFMHDRLSARLMKTNPTGNGRRQSYAHDVLPRMTNTYMANGEFERDEILNSVKDGIFAVKLGGGQVNPTSGDFVFECTEAYKIRGGKVEEPIKGATIVGNGPVAMKNAVMVGRDSALDPGIGVCGKMGQTVPVGVGQPMVRLDQMTVGGTA